MATTFAPGSVVVVRDEEWLVAEAEQGTDGWRLDVVGLGELVRETTATFFSRLDNIALLDDPRGATLLPDGSPRHRRLWLETAARPRTDAARAVVPVRAAAGPARQ